MIDLIDLIPASDFTPDRIWNYFWSNNEDNKQISRNTVHYKLLSEIEILVKSDTIAALNEKN